MENKGLLFIPDISGFTRFVTDMEIEHSRYIIKELLEVLIDSNQLGLEVSEVEGDAILFYKYGVAPAPDAIFRQVEKMFCAFHRHLQSYEYRRFCQCKACVNAFHLSLKVITHYGEFTGYAVKSFQKLIGKDVIIAHQLLKNDIEQHEYWLATPGLIGDNPDKFKEWMKWNIGEKETETGNIRFHYAQLSELKNEMDTEQPSSIELSPRYKCFSTSHEFNRNVKVLFFATVHFEFRNQWLEGVRKIEEVEHFIPGIGSRHRCILEKEQRIVVTTSLSYHPESKIVFSEADEDRSSAIYFILEPLGYERSRLTIELYVPSKLMRTMFNLFMKNKTSGQMERSMERLEKVVNDIVLPVEF